jgi:hypothetical protein
MITALLRQQSDTGDQQHKNICEENQALTAGREKLQVSPLPSFQILNVHSSIHYKEPIAYFEIIRII